MKQSGLLLIKEGRSHMQSPWNAWGNFEYVEPTTISHNEEDSIN